MFSQHLPFARFVLAVGFVFTIVIFIMVLIFEPILKFLWYWHAPSEDPTHVVTDLIHQLLVSGYHHLRAGHVDGVGPVSAAVHELGETQLLGLNNGIVTPVHLNTLIW